jgi:uncharacterized membrane protein HdeD (DUF308 family)
MVPNFNQSNKHFPWWVVLLEGIFALIFGILLLANPAAATAALVQLLGFYFVIHGIFQLVSIFIEPSMWGWKLCGGILGILAGMVVINHPLWSTLLVPATIVIFLGVDALIIGVISLVQTFKGGGWLAGILGVIGILIGFALLGTPLITSWKLSYVYGMIGVAGGFIAIYSAFKLRTAESLKVANSTNTANSANTAKSKKKKKKS